MMRAKQPRRWSRSLLLLLLALGLLAGACSEGKKSGESSKDKDQPPAQVDLPDPPPASALTIPEKNDDGTFRVRGLIAHRGKHLGSKVEVKGIVTSMTEKCDPSKAKKRGEKCPQPHMFIQDDSESDRALMVVGYEDEFIDRADLEKGQQQAFKGTYKRLSHGFVASEHGLLLLDAAGDTKVLEDE